MKNLNNQNLEKVSGGLIIQLEPTKDSAVEAMKTFEEYENPELMKRALTRYMAGQDGERPFINHSPEFKSLEEAKAYAMDKGWSTKLIVKKFVLSCA